MTYDLTGTPDLQQPQITQISQIQILESVKSV